MLLAFFATPVGAAPLPTNAASPAHATRTGCEVGDIAPAAGAPQVFVDALKQAGPWTSTARLALDPDGNVAFLASGQSAQRLAYAAGQAFPTGDYTLLFTGKAQIAIDGATVVASSAGRIVVHLEPSPVKSVRLRILATDSADPVRDVRLILPGFEKTYSTQPFFPQFVASLSGCDMLRFATWSRATTLVTSRVWPLRPRVSRATQAAPEGVAPEYEIALANAVGADPWFVLPVGATNAYVYGVADLVHRFLDPRLRPTFEYGDRVWNPGTPEYAYAQMAARNFRLGGGAAGPAVSWYSLRSTQVFAIVDRALGTDAPRVTHGLSVPGTQNSQADFVARAILSTVGAGHAAGALIVDARDSMGAATTFAVSKRSGGPALGWYPQGAARWAGVGMAPRPRVARMNIAFAVGADTTPVALHHATMRGRAPVQPPTSNIRGFKPLTAPAPAGATSDEAQYHNDVRRSGWNADEPTLNVANVASSNFGLVATLRTGANVLAQPLYLEDYPIRGARHNIVIVATEHNSILEFDAISGARLNAADLGPSQNSFDVGCLDIRFEYGISSTPVIDRSSGTMYVIAPIEPKPMEFHAMLHALDIATLKDKVPPVEIQATTTISNGTTISFDPQNQMNRAGLVWANNSLYVGVGSHCDNNPQAITGWVLRYDASLHQIGKFATIEDSTSYALSSVWMTGFAPAVGGSGNLYVITGNGDFDADHGGKNFGESVLRLSPDLKKVRDYFTPANWNDLNNGDTDFGSGGIMLLPPQQAADPYTAVAMGKFSTLYLLNRENLGKVQSNDAGALQSIPNTGFGVWGGPAYYSGPAGQFVYYQADGSPLLAFAVGENNNGVPQLKLTSTGSSNAGYGGSLPVVSSNGQKPGTAVVWLVNRSRPLQLEAYDATDLSHLLFQGQAGTWENTQNNGFVTPLVAAGKVYVPSSGVISVFGLGHKAGAIGSGAMTAGATSVRQLHGTIVGVAGNLLTLRLRDGRIERIDIAAARSARHAGVLPVGRAVVVYGLIGSDGKFHATSIGHTSQNAKNWSKDN